CSETLVTFRWRSPLLYVSGLLSVMIASKDTSVAPGGTVHGTDNDCSTYHGEPGPVKVFENTALPSNSTCPVTDSNVSLAFWRSWRTSNVNVTTCPSYPATTKSTSQLASGKSPETLRRTSPPNWSRGGMGHA